MIPYVIYYFKSCKINYKFRKCSKVSIIKVDI